MTDSTNYRPVSLISTICKLMQTIITNKIMTHAKQQPFHQQTIWVFTRKIYGTSTYEGFDKWTEEYDKGKRIKEKQELWESKLY